VTYATGTNLKAKSKCPAMH